LWISKKYGDRIAAFFRRNFVDPVAARVRDWKERSRLRKREAAVQRAMSQLPDPFRELLDVSSAQATDLPSLFGAVVADAYLIGAEMAESETMGLFLGRLNRVHDLPRSEIETVRRVCAQAEFALVPPTNEEVSRAFTAGQVIRTAVRKRVSEEMLSKKQVAYRRQLAEAKLDAEQPTPSEMNQT